MKNLLTESFKEDMRSLNVKHRDEFYRAPDGSLAQHTHTAPKGKGLPNSLTSWRNL